MCVKERCRLREAEKTELILVKARLRAYKLLIMYERIGIESIGRMTEF